MSYAETPVPTDVDKILAAIELQNQKIDQLTDALNTVGANVQWAIDQGKGIFQMFSSPGFMANMGGILGGINHGGGLEAGAGIPDGPGE